MSKPKDPTDTTAEARTDNGSDLIKGQLSSIPVSDAEVPPSPDPISAPTELESLTFNTETVTQLTGAESGVWLVHTQSGTIHIFDLHTRTVERCPGVNGYPLDGDEPRVLRSIERCHLNESGLWTFVSRDFMTDYYWQVCSPIQRIERATP
jgi:hypothetical protein